MPTPRPVALAALAALSLAACGGGGGSTSPSSTRLEVACAADTAGRTPVLTVLGRAVVDGAPPAAPVVVTVSAQAQSLTFEVGGALGQGLGEFEGVAPVAGSKLTARATLGGSQVTGTCTVAAGLAAVAPRALATPSGAAVSWPAVAGATRYRVEARDPATGNVLASATTPGGSADLAWAREPFGTELVHVTALSVDPAAAQPTPLPAPRAANESVAVTSGATGGDGSPWQLFSGKDYVGDTLTVTFPALGPGERLGLLLVNAQGPDASAPSVGVTGVGAAPARLAPRMVAGAEPAPDLVALGHELARARGERAVQRWRDEGAPRAVSSRAATPAPAVVGDARSFCIFNFGTNRASSQPATVRHATAHAAFYVTDAVWPSFEAVITGSRPDLWSVLGTAYEAAILPALGTYFGPESDVDGNGQMSFVFADLGRTGTGGFVVGYFDPTDVLFAADPGCGGTGSNGADVLYLLDIATFNANAPTRFTYDVIVDEEYPGTMAHELQHNVNFNVRCLLGPCNPTEETWLNEGLSMVSEDVAGFGLHATAERARVASYLGRFRDFSLTGWEADPVGNYGGVHAFMRYVLDQEGPGFTRALVNDSRSSIANFEAASGVPWEVAMARFATASLLSQEPVWPADPAYDLFSYDGTAPWAPWHTQVGYVNYIPLPQPQNPTTTTLRRNGWAAFVTGSGTGGPATLTVTSAATTKPHAVVVRFPGDLPR
jgi:hypothetical protein